jgi:hypothetical protein
MKTPGGMSKPIDFIGLKAQPQGTNQPGKGSRLPTKPILPPRSPRTSKKSIG